MHKRHLFYVSLYALLAAVGAAAAALWLSHFSDLAERTKGFLALASAVLGDGLFLLFWRKMAHRFRLLTNLLRFSLFFLFAWGATHLTSWAAYRVHQYFSDRMGRYYPYYILHFDAIVILVYGVLLVVCLVLAGSLAKSLVNPYRIHTRAERGMTLNG